ncbi:homeobox expressed in ES cells 1 [Mobula hypostoma]|uniref:homeobox expressed in ES cells 1 n=1 Tax=Mobula hypostoma TaxID=723540 RepID=UPI002FC2EDC8
MAKFCPRDLTGDLKAHYQPAETRKVSGRKVSTCSFTIESILGLETNEKTTCIIDPYRPWADVLNITAFPGTSCSNSSERSHDLPYTRKEDKGSDRDLYCTKVNRRNEDRVSYPPNCCWFRGRRPRTAFSRSQIEVLEEEFRLNCYPGIDVREELAQKLALDEDRIQIWFQNRRAKLKRSHRESQFLMVKNALIRSDVQNRKPSTQV